MYLKLESVHAVKDKTLNSKSKLIQNTAPAPSNYNLFHCDKNDLDSYTQFLFLQENVSSEEDFCPDYLKFEFDENSLVSKKLKKQLSSTPRANVISKDCNFTNLFFL
ncbi:hypothetical protein NPIL_464361 [Nephila pilipes]|uniref:Uncharacterized protein n=1 Tax=Nephila pilipes TaxID=299642 RepID=A0A8X6MLU3_NEPPI|nr:hypothetical protein NPIL_464361 [Nephila pilipes]